jgi:large subunit ribosomal protein L9
MKVILIDEIRGLGTRGDVVQVKDGYARNFLLPKKLAREATAGNLKAVEQERKKWAALASQEKDEAKKSALLIEGLKLVVKKKVGESGTLYGSVTTNDIADQLLAKGIGVDKRKIELSHPIKSLGLHDVEIRLNREVAAKVQVEVVGDGEHAAKAEKAAAARAASDKATAESKSSRKGKAVAVPAAAPIEPPPAEAPVDASDDLT